MGKYLWDLFKDSKYRIDFTFRKKNNFVWKETYDLLDNNYDAKEYVYDTFYNPCFPLAKEEIKSIFRGCDAIKIEIIRIVTNEVCSMYWWENDEMGEQGK